MRQRFKTESGSEYEVDHETKRIRRILGRHAPTDYQGKDGEWRSYHNCIIELGHCAIIHWEAGQPRGTITTRVTGIE